MIGSPDFSQPPAVEYFFFELHSVQSPVCPFDFSCASTLRWQRQTYVGFCGNKR